MIAEDYAAIDIAAALLKHNLSDISVDSIDAIDDINFDGTEMYGGSSEKMIRLFINAGKKNKVRVKDIVGAIAGETGVSGKTLGSIDLFDDYAFIDVPSEYAKDIIHGMKNAKIKNKKVNIEIAKKAKNKK